MKFTIVTVSYNAADTIEDTILSVSNQKGVDLEYIIIDGKSSDGTIDIIDNYQKKGYVSLWISESDKGIYDAMNKALDIASGDYLIFLGADDVFYNTNVLKDVERKIKDMTCIYYGRVIYKSGLLSRGEIKNALDLCRVNISHQSIFYPKPVFSKKRYNLKYKIYADYVYNMELFSENTNPFVFLDQIISVFNEQGISGTRKDVAFENDRLELVHNLFGYKVSVFLAIGLKIKAGLRIIGIIK